MNFDVSVIIPSYNSKAFIKPCVDSILNQTLKNVEVIIVDDCSTDDSFEVCQTLYGSNERVQLLRQPKNAGPGEARNTGILKARGTYINFCDSDDEMLPEMLENMFNTAKEYDADILHNTHIKLLLPPDGNMPAIMTDPQYAKYLVPIDLDRNEASRVTGRLGEDLDERFNLWLQHRYHWGVWNKLYKRDFLIKNDITFCKMKLAEDLIFCFTCLMLAKNYVVMPGGWYIYRLTLASFSRQQKSAGNILKAVRSQVEAISNMAAATDKIPFLKNSPDKAKQALEAVFASLEEGFIRPNFQMVGEALANEEAFKTFFTETFGENAPLVEFLFMELHRHYPEVKDYMGAGADPDTWKKVRSEIDEAEKSGQDFNLMETIDQGIK